MPLVHCLRAISDDAEPPVPQPLTDDRPELLFLCHRIPYPPDKGDKIRSYRWWKTLIEHFRVHLGAFIDDPDDWRHVARIEASCTSSLFRPLRRRTATLRSLGGLIDGRPLSLPYYRDGVMARWVRDRLASSPGARVFVYSSAMAQYVTPKAASSALRVIDFVDVDSDKWSQYAQAKPWPLSWVYRREGRRLASYESGLARAFDLSLLVSAQEATLFQSRLGHDPGRVTQVPNGVDTAYFDPRNGGATPFEPGTEAIVFTGAMDYWANVDAVVWFAREVLPLVRASRPAARFVIVGSNPSAAVSALAGTGVIVTGRVPDVRPYLAHGSVVVAPMRIARGIQNKVLEAMAMARPVVVTPSGLEGIAADANEVLVADQPRPFADAVLAVLSGRHTRLGEAARRRVSSDYSWDQATDRLLSLLSSSRAAIADRSLPTDDGTALVPGQGLGAKMFPD